MKKLVFLALLLTFLGFFLFKSAKDTVKKDLASPVSYPTTTVSPEINYQNKSDSPEMQAIFVPYWALKANTEDQTGYNNYIYFGVVPNQEGLDTKDPGSLALDNFLSFVPSGKKKLLAVRMIDADTNFAILKDTAKQKKVISQAITLAKENNFDGIVLDLEVSAIPFESLVSQINSFTASFYQQTKQNQLNLALTIYGDVFYRLRPFDVKALAHNSDQIMIMAYDFSKAKGNPGPNFPLRGVDTYGYDYTKMTEDFLKVVPPEKLTVVFGLFGYDWSVDSQGKALLTGKALSTQEIENRFIKKCQEVSCEFSRDSKSFETEVKYTDKAGEKHIVWFEDMDSVAAKKAYLKKRGITSFAYWAYSYF